MTKSVAGIAGQVINLCTLIGGDPLLVQGPGGNISWKDGDNLWVKASGTWLAEAGSREIFVPVDLRSLRDAIKNEDFNVKIPTKHKGGLQPSIETLLHALMPHRVVVHLHAVEVLAHLVRRNARRRIQDLVGDVVKSVFVDYSKPGADLTRAVFTELRNSPDVDVVFLGNHGLVIGAECVEDVASVLNNLVIRMQSQRLALKPRNSCTSINSLLVTKGYVPCNDGDVNLLATQPELTRRLRHQWALYPDHVVFLGGEANILEEDFTNDDLDERLLLNSPFIFALGDGVYESRSTTPAQKSFLRCYFDVLIRQSFEEELSPLSLSQVNELLCWDAEMYRKKFNENRAYCE